MKNDSVLEIEAVHAQGGEYAVSFVYAGARHNLGVFRSRSEAVLAFRRRYLNAARTEQERAARSASKIEKDKFARDKPSPRLNERFMSPYALSLLLDYDPDLGLLVPVEAGSLTFSDGGNSGDIPRVVWRGTPYYSHRVCWCLMTGVWPDGRVLWRDENRKNLRWSNLYIRDAK